MSQTRSSSYKKLFSQLEESEDIFERQILDRIQIDYDRFHENDLKAFIELLPDQEETECLNCGSRDFIRYGKDRNGFHRYRCKKCNQTFSETKSSLFFASKINIKAWFEFLECLLSGTSVHAACLAAKISPVTGSVWMRKIFLTLKDYQDSICLGKEVFIDETYVHEDKSKIFYYEELGKIKKVKKQPRGISRNKICILLATDKKNSFAEIEGKGRPHRDKNYSICQKHITEGSHLIGDEDTSMTYTVECMKLKRTMYKGGTETSYKELVPIDQLCNRFKFFINKHRGFKKDLLQDYINLFIFIDNENNEENDLYKVTMKLLKMMFEYKKTSKDAGE